MWALVGGVIIIMLELVVDVLEIVGIKAVLVLLV